MFRPKYSDAIRFLVNGGQISQIKLKTTNSLCSYYGVLEAHSPVRLLDFYVCRIILPHRH